MNFKKKLKKNLLKKIYFTLTKPKTKFEGKMN